MRLFLFMALLALSVPASAYAEPTLVGIATVIDGETIEAIASALMGSMRRKAANYALMPATEVSLRNRGGSVLDGSLRPHGRRGAGLSSGTGMAALLATATEQMGQVSPSCWS
jgi:hypothetical protein